MRYLILIGDGMADHPLAEHGGKTPLELANTPGLDQIAREGVLGNFGPIPEGMPAGSEIGILSLFGYDPREVFRGRAPLEAANQGIPLAPNEVIFRCNLVDTSGAKMTSFTSGHITSEESRGIVDALNASLGARYPVRFHTGVGYRHLMVLDTVAAGLDGLMQLGCTPPHNIPDAPIAEHLPTGPGDDYIRTLMLESTLVVAAHPVSAARRERGEHSPTQIWLWGQGVQPDMPTYKALYGHSGAVISAVDLVNGIGVLAGFEVVRVPGATGWIDTNYTGKFAAGADALARHDVVVVHLEAPDETAHQGRVDLKVQAIEDFDRHIVQPALALAAGRDDLRIFAAPDHFTLCSTKKHAPGHVPFGMVGAGITPAGGAPAYTEANATATGIVVPHGHEAVQRFLREALLTFAPATA